MTTSYDALIASFAAQGQITLGTFAAAAAVLLVTWLFYRAEFMRRFILPVWVAYLLAMWTGALFVGVYGQ
jgi:hypothetical protein